MWSTWVQSGFHYLNGKGSIWLWSTWVQSGFHYLNGKGSIWLWSTWVQSGFHYLNGKGSIWLWSTWVQSCFHYLNGKGSIWLWSTWVQSGFHYINGKGSIWLWSTWVQSGFHYFFNRSMSYSWWCGGCIPPHQKLYIYIYIYIYIQVASYSPGSGHCLVQHADRSQVSSKLQPAIPRVKCYLAHIHMIILSPIFYSPEIFILLNCFKSPIEANLILCPLNVSMAVSSQHSVCTVL